MDITEFWTARLDEREQRARAANADDPWFCEGSDGVERLLTEDGGEFVFHRRALREVERDRKVMAEHAPVEQHGGYGCAMCGEHPPGDAESWPCSTYRLHVAVWSDRPDYQPEWAPEA